MDQRESEHIYFKNFVFCSLSHNSEQLRLIEFRWNWSKEKVNMYCKNYVLCSHFHNEKLAIATKKRKCTYYLFCFLSHTKTMEIYFFSNSDEIGLKWEIEHIL
jgi:hypothetical protein